MNFPVKVYLCGSEVNGWALDADLATTRQSLLHLPELVELVPLQDADVVYSVWEYPVLQMQSRQLEGKRIVCQICNNFMRIHEDPWMIRSKETVGLWVPMSQECVKVVEALGYDYAFVPYAVDTTVFTPDLDEKSTILQLRRYYAIPEAAFVISNFMRDSSAGDLLLPKQQKGVELLLQIGIELSKKDIPVHFLLAGPRRHWIRRQMNRYAIPFTFIGREKDTDDNDINILTPDVINRLYHISDLHLVTSRWEGGPRAVLESAATKTPILSTPVGIAPDILRPDSLYASIDEGVEKIERHYIKRHLNESLDPQYHLLVSNHTPRANIYRFRTLFEKIEKVSVYKKCSNGKTPQKVHKSLGKKIVGKIGAFWGAKSEAKPLHFSLWHEFHNPPYGGGNQFMIALSDALERNGAKVSMNKLSSAVDIHICNSAWFDHRLFEKKQPNFPFG